MRHFIPVGLIFVFCVYFCNSSVHITKGGPPFLDDGVHFLFSMNFSEIFHVHNKTILYVYEVGCDVNDNNCPYNNFTKVARMLNSSMLFTRINYKENVDLMKGYTIKLPSIVYFVNKTCYHYNGTFSLEDIYNNSIMFIKNELTFPPSKVVYVDKYNYTEYFKNIPFALLLTLIDNSTYDRRDSVLLGMAYTISERLSEENVPVAISYEATSPEILEKYKISSTGIYYVIRYGKSYEFGSGSDSSSVTNVINKAQILMKFGSDLFNNYKEGIYQIKRYFSSFHVVFVAVISSKNSSWYFVFEEIVHNMRGNYKFFHTFGMEAGNKFGCEEKDCFLAIYSDKTVSPYDEQRLKSFTLKPNELEDSNLVKKYIEKAQRPLVGYLDNNGHAINAYQGIYPKLILYIDTTMEGQDYKETAFYQKQLWDVAKDYRAISFVFSPKEGYEVTLKERGLFESDNDVDVVLELSNKYYYVMKEKFNVKNLRLFINSYTKGSIRPNVKSENIPDIEYDENNIRILVGKNFDEIVFNSSYDIVILFYVDWCDFCKSFKPIFAEAAQKYKKYNKLVFAKFNCEKNDPAPEYQVDEYPKIYFGQFNSKKTPQVYTKTNNDTLASFSDFIESSWTIMKSKDTTAKSDL